MSTIFVNNVRFLRSCFVFALFSSSLQFHNKLFSVLGRIRFCEVVAHVSFILSHSFENKPGNQGRWRSEILAESLAPVSGLFGFILVIFKFSNNERVMGQAGTWPKPTHSWPVASWNLAFSRSTMQCSSPLSNYLCTETQKVLLILSCDCDGSPFCHPIADSRRYEQASVWLPMAYTKWHK